jgi:hypothetical protein
MSASVSRQPVDAVGDTDRWPMGVDVFCSMVGRGFVVVSPEPFGSQQRAIIRAIRCGEPGGSIWAAVQTDGPRPGIFPD